MAIKSNPALHDFPMVTISNWWNFATQSWDGRTTPPQTDDEARQYIPQDAPAQQIYRIHRELGEDVLHALLKTLEMMPRK